MVRKLDNAFISAKTLGTHTVNRLKAKATGDETLIIKIMLMVIAVALVLIFRDTLTTIIKNLLTGTNGLQTKIEALYNSASSTTP